ncbi:hypothetical protein HanRHA438_Chr07g0296091 [Helianthus annuus]|uniref:Uncharacterized protein n=1 Tax=Helianthus annuus TaxID=4232 RepID=A0A9K3NFG7_HELAN|nr:hypothetical protein HanXRQr2_Chr07g0285511 [Helianthus annuus]KAJ0549524.1 hypothetical protein HanHA300_Chr07g0234701 [Helianthus annuus]KAJ0555933.1 hypothetical protein HanIR_Chr07g0307841 [Helianthus annuus]KAJ0562479.1 hypothetical protein HanHA89_Chr07g0251881 [Helianthus annuus]KAJ0727854.1 hypothetical protein HanLR1_Chr07g0234641 [Helianthus annuus]
MKPVPSPSLSRDTCSGDGAGGADRCRSFLFQPHPTRRPTATSSYTPLTPVLVPSKTHPVVPFSSPSPIQAPTTSPATPPYPVFPMMVMAVACGCSLDDDDEDGGDGATVIRRYRLKLRRLVGVLMMMVVPGH